MATFFSGSTNERDIMQAFSHRDGGQASYPDSSFNSNMLYPNYASSGPYSEMLAGVNAQSQQNFMELPVSSAMISPNSSVGDPNFGSSRLGDFPYNTWKDGRNQMFMQRIDGAVPDADGLIRSSLPDDTHMGIRTHLDMLSGQSLSLHQSNHSAMQGQGLSLSLSTQIPVTSFQYKPSNADFSILSPHQSASGNDGPCRDDYSRSKQMHGNPSPYALSSLASTIPNSRYLKAAQQLLDEVVNVRKALKNKTEKSQSLNASAGTGGYKDNDGGEKSNEAPSNPQESTTISSAELSPSERQDLQNKITKLLAMLDEVDRRYKKYYHQMQIVVSSFDIIAGCGAAKPYTALALQTISRHFRCLRDAINDQIRSARKSLGEEDNSTSKGVGISRLRYIDQQLRQQRAMQQLGMTQHAWRPQRGLPETSVSVLRAWLFEHFLHPYPKDSEKLMLARQTGLTRGQVSNWFINARVRLWKPMIEDMYKEELGDAEIDSNSFSDLVAKEKEEMRSSDEKEELQSPGSERCHSHTSQLNDPLASSVIPVMDISGGPPGFNKRIADGSNPNFKIQNQRRDGEDFGLLHDALGHPDGGGRFMAYQMAEMGQYSTGGVSLTLGLQHCDGIPVPNSQQGFRPMRGEDMYTSGPSLGADTADYDRVNLVDRRQRYEPPHVLHDFVA